MKPNAPLVHPEKESTEAVTANPFERLDVLVRTKGTRGFCAVLAQRGIRAPLIRHVMRRARAIERHVVEVSRAGTNEPWRALASRLGISPRTDPAHFARDVLRTNAVLIVDDTRPSAWGMSVWTALQQAFIERGGESGPLVLAFSDPGVHWMREALSIEEHVDPEARTRFVEALVVDELREIPEEASTLPALEACWRSHRTASLPSASTGLEPESAKLLARLRLVGQSWPLAALSSLGSARALEELTGAGLVEVDARQVWLQTTHSPRTEVATTSKDALDAAVALDALQPADPWSRMRAAELFTEAGDAERAEAAALAAIRLAEHADLRNDLWARHAPDHEYLPRAGIGDRWLRAAECALEHGDSDWARTFARRAVVGNASAAKAMLLLGRAEAAKGDLTAAATALDRAARASVDEEQRFEASAHAADVAWLAGKMDRARTLADAACASTHRQTRALARNVLGKVLLSAGRLDEAEAQFAEGACEAGLANEPIAALRADLNRAIVSLTRGRHEDARALLRSVLTQGEKLGELRVIAYAVTNLAVVATLCHEYAEALVLAERSMALAENVQVPRALMNLASVRLKVGLDDEAEEALACGHGEFGVNLSPAHQAEYALVSAKVHFARGRMLQARAHLERALASARAADTPSVTCECHLAAARFALEDGDIERAGTELMHAATTAETPARRAEVALLRAKRARAAGEAFEDLAQDARNLAQTAQHPELLREAHFLLYQVCLAEGDGSGARDQLRLALRYRDDVASALPPALRDRYLARRELGELRQAETRTIPEETSNDAPRPSPRSAGTATARQLVGQSARVLGLRAAIEKVGPSDATVLVLGESGTGKELVAEALHAQSPRRRGPLVKVNCAALTESLLASELFGHEKGAFTGALSRRRGRFELGDGGTLFLDEIGDISPATQVALLRVLQEHTIERVGGGIPIRVDVRVVTATHRDLGRLVERGLFRQDLYYRLRGIVLEVPSLRSIREDVPAIARALLHRISSERGEPAKRLAPDALDVLCRYDWPGNVRELENALRAASVFASGDCIEARDLCENVDTLRKLPTSEEVLATASEREPVVAEPGELVYDHVRTGVSLGDMKRKLERECIVRALQDSGGNITRAAFLLGMKRPRLSQLVKKYQLFAEDTEQL